MGRKKKKNEKLLSRIAETCWAVVGSRAQGLGAKYFLKIGMVAVLLVVLTYGLLRVEQSVTTTPAYREGSPEIAIVDVPPGLEDIMREAVRPFAKGAWFDGALCAELGIALEETGWVRRVESVHRFADRRVEVKCVYRCPAALVQTHSGFFLVDQDCVRLPGCYENHPSMMLIQGVACPAPKPGEIWDADDLRAGVELIKILSNESYSTQITAVLVQNYGGRVNPDRAHIALATDRAGERILWGSAPGGEVEENSVEEKLRILRSNYRRFGRVDATRGVIDISVHPDRIIAPGSARTNI